MFNGTEMVLPEILSGILSVESWTPIVALVGGGGILWHFKDEILSFIQQIRYPRKEFLHKKAKKLQQSDFGIQHPPGTNTEVYKQKDSYGEIENYLKNSKDLLIIGMPKAGKTRSAYQAIKSVLPEFYVIRPHAEKPSDFIISPPKKNYLIFFDDLNKFTNVNFDFRRFLDKFDGKSKKMVVLSTCRSGAELDDVKSKSMEFFRIFKIVDLNDYPLSGAEGEQLAEDVGVKWKPEQFNGTPGSVVLDDGDMKERYKRLDDRQKVIMRACKLLRSANSFTYKKDLLKNVCAQVFETKIDENGWINSINRLEGNSLITRTERSINNINVYDSTLDSVVYDYSPEDHLLSLLEFFAKARDAKSIFYLGTAFYGKKDHENAKKCYRKCLKFNPHIAVAHYNLGVLLQELERYDVAEKEYRDAIRIDPDYAVAHNNLGNLLNDLKRYDEAEEECRDAIRIDPDYAVAHNNLGISLYYLKRYDKAEKVYRDAIRIDLDYAAAHNNLGGLLQELKRYDEAEKEYRDAIRIDPDYVAAHTNLGGLLQDLGRYNEAEEEWREAIRIDPDDVAAHYNLGGLLQDLGRYNEAEEEWREAIRIDPADVAAHGNLGNLLYYLKRYDGTEKEWREAIRVNPDDAVAHNNLGGLLQDLGRYNEAEEECRDAIRIDPDYAEAHGNLGVLFQATYRPDEAKKEFKTAKELFENQGREEDVKKVKELLANI